jgi:hypothetical protein
MSLTDWLTMNVCCWDLEFYEYFRICQGGYKRRDLGHQQNIGCGCCKLKASDHSDQAVWKVAPLISYKHNFSWEFFVKQEWAECQKCKDLLKSRNNLSEISLQLYRCSSLPNQIQSNQRQKVPHWEYTCERALDWLQTDCIKRAQHLVMNSPRAVYSGSQL